MEDAKLKLLRRISQINADRCNFSYASYRMALDSFIVLDYLRRLVANCENENDLQSISTLVDHYDRDAQWRPEGFNRTDNA